MSAGPTRLVQLDHPGFGRRVALVDGDDLHLLGTYRSIYSFAIAAIETGWKLRDLLSTDLTGIALDYAAVHALDTEWRFLPSFDHPSEPARCMVSGCGRTYDAPTRSGEPDPGPSWFYKGTAATLRGHGEPLVIPSFAAAGGEEAELVVAYVVDSEGIPRRVGVTAGNEFADPALPARDPAAGPQAKLRTCSVGPELVLDAAIADVRGTVSIERSGASLWSREIRMGEDYMRYSLADIERNHFRYDAHRRPGDAHLHYLGAAAASYLDGVRLEDGDQVSVEFEGLGRPLRNPIVREHAQAHVAVASL
jgi:hypothetical protein